MEIFGDTATVYRDFATEAYGSACFREWALGVAGDPDVLAWLQTLPERKRQANLVFAAARWHGVPAPGPYAALRDALLGDEGSIRPTILERATQTNEVGRLATLYPAFASLGTRPLALLEVGASAGLCLYPDRYSYRWTLPDGTSRETVRRSLRHSSARPPATRRRACCPRSCGEPASTSRPSTSPTTRPSAGWRRWCGRSRTNAASACAGPSRSPAPTRRTWCGATCWTRCPPWSTQAPPDATLVVFHSAVIAYLAHADRARFAAMMTDLVADGRCHWVSNEGPRVLPDLVPPGVDVPFGRFVLAVDGRPVALTHGHGAELDWL